MIIIVLNNNRSDRNKNIQTITEQTSQQTSPFHISLLKSLLSLVNLMKSCCYVVNIYCFVPVFFLSVCFRMFSLSPAQSLSM